MDTGASRPVHTTELKELTWVNLTYCKQPFRNHRAYGFYARGYDVSLPAHELSALSNARLATSIWKLPSCQNMALKVSSGALGLPVECGRGSDWLRSTARLQNLGESALARVPMHTGETLRVSLSYAEETTAVLLPLDQTVSERIASSARRWQKWARQAHYDGPHRDVVVQQRLTLKLLTYSLSGAIVGRQHHRFRSVSGAA
jgi:hypothetical protein